MRKITLEDIFFAYLKSINMLNTFPTVLVMDSTYKTNTYRMPLFEIAGVTSTKITYSVAFSFLSFELEDDFTWALEMLVGLLTSTCLRRLSLIWTRYTLMNVVAKFLLETYHINCYFHIGKNVKAKCITYCRVKAKPTNAKFVEKEVKEAKEKKYCYLVKKIIRVWKEVVESPTEDTYGSALLKFKEVCEPFPKFVEYVEPTVLTVKKKFARAWTNKVLHLGCRTTNIV